MFLVKFATFNNNREQSKKFNSLAEAEAFYQSKEESTIYCEVWAQVDNAIIEEFRLIKTNNEI